MKTKLVLFDFDGTLTRKDTLLEFLLYTQGVLRTGLGFFALSFSLAAWKLGLQSNNDAKQRLLQHFFRGLELPTFNEQCASFATSKIPNLLREQSIALLEKYKKENARIIVVSASPENWVRPWCEQWQIECIATRLEVRNGLLTGNIDGLNCYGKQKELRVREVVNLADYSTVVAYGDTRGDKEMLAMANEPHFRELI